MVEWLLQPDVLIYLAGGSFVLGYLIINQVILRTMVLIGTLIYILYYATVADQPLWAAIYTSVAMGLANLIGLGLLFVRRSKLAIPEAHRDIYPRFVQLSPGDFRSLMRHAHRFRTLDEEVLTTQGQPVSHLSYIISGNAQVTKRDTFLELPPGVFVGEVAYLQGTPSAATTVLPEGSELLQWKVQDLARIGARNQRFKLAIEAAISRDMAAKVAQAVAPQSLKVNPNLL